MQNYAPGNAIVVTFQLRNEASEVITPTALRRRVLDEEQMVLQDWLSAVVSDLSEDEVSFTIDAALTHLMAGANAGVRTIELEVTTDAGKLVLTESVLIQATTSLMPGLNSFVTYSRALMVSQGFTTTAMNGWNNTLQRDERERALQQAFRSIMQLPVRVKGVHVRDMLPEQFALVAPALIDALRNAQVLEASAALEADPVMTARRNGLISMTVGESSQFFGESKQLNNSLLSTEAFAIISRWLDYSVKLARG
jgi:hypothetical protein